MGDFKANVCDKLQGHICGIRDIMLSPKLLENDLDSLIKNELDEKNFVFALKMFLMFYSIPQGYFAKIDAGYEINFDKYIISRIFNDPANSKVKYYKRIKFYKQIIRRLKSDFKHIKNADGKMANTPIEFRHEQEIERAVKRKEDFDTQTEEVYKSLNYKEIWEDGI